MSVTVTALQDAGVRVLDCEHKTPAAQRFGHPYIAIPDIQDGRVVLDQVRLISDDNLAEWTRRTVPIKGDILVTRRGRVGDTAPVPDVPCAIGQNIVLLRSDGTKVHKDFLRWAVRSPEWWSEVERLLNVGAVFSSLNVKDIGRIRLSIPPIAEQQAIAEVLGALDDKIAANTALADTAEQMLRAEIDAAWLRSEGRSSTLSDFVEINPKVAVPRTDSAVYIDMKRLPESGWSINGFDYREPRGGARFRNGDTLLARITPCLENRKTGFVDHLEDGQVGIGSTEFIVLRSRNDVAAPISFLLATAPRFRDHAIQHMIGTSGRQRVAASDLASFEMPTPEPGWLSDFGGRAEAIFEAISMHSAENRTLAATRDALLPQLMSGKVRVRDAEATASEAGV
ncbi:restriction endonuclease subunit S [Curtobacterium sp. VKM Ac-2922]|uniref:restriction endonuclease subunit S n=1 Tax=Curtobacterium sp. VKM Ac-2922 TaxID=2929475 RepID=UPI001FB21680|nr:restriction endonuclease subunit S [Curtobacterium sp. VKM Ac-2922]MCJ1715409.1 restriction endonuclease subunit S [Curtobacterium sp. VKM Ac-2922]